MDIKLNTNLEVSVKLTEEGKKIYKSYRENLTKIKKEKYGIINTEVDTNYSDLDNTLTVQMWELMNIFGRHILKEPFEDNNILINRRELTLYNEINIEKKG